MSARKAAIRTGTMASNSGDNNSIDSGLKLDLHFHLG